MHLKRSLLALPLTAMLTAVLVGLSGGSAQADVPYINLVHQGTNECLDLRGEDSRTIQQWECVHNQNQAWQIVLVTGSSGGTVYHLVVRRNGRCIGIPGNSLDVGAFAEAQPCSVNTSTLSQLWRVRFTQDINLTRYYTFENLYSGYCLDAQYNSGGNGAPVWQYPCNGTNAQVWREQPA